MDAPGLRYELKGVAAASGWDTLRTWLRLHRAGFRAVHPPRTVNSVYFDTYDLRCWEENLSGQSRRTKVRYRWYGHAALPAAGALELKRRLNRLGAKESAPVAEPFLPGDCWAECHRRLLAAAPPALAAVLAAHPFATSLIRYRREYFASADGRLRVTLDRDLCALDQRASVVPNLVRRSNLPDVAVLELKCEATQREQAARALHDAPLRITRFSKYAVALENG
jgi:hypothetical protein